MWGTRQQGIRASKLEACSPALNNFAVVHQVMSEMKLFH
jgi:hypothetical protein